MKRYIILILISAQTLSAGGWNKKKGELFAKYEFRYIQASNFYDFTGTSTPFVTTTNFSNSLYAEYGLFDNLTLVSNIPFFRGTIQNRLQTESGAIVPNTGAKHTGLGDITMGARYGISQSGSTVFALTAQLDLPTGATGHPALLLGDGEFSTQLGLEAGHSFYPIQAYSTAFLGYNFRNEGFSDELVYGFEFGYHLTPQFLVSSKVRGVHAVKGVPQSADWKTLFSQSTYTAYSIEAYYSINDRVGISIGIDSAFQAKNALKAPTYTTGIFLSI